MGRFVTGVTVVTTRAASGEYAGLTVNSFASLSLSPPLVLWSLALSAASFPAFETSTHFAVNVLAEDQIYIAERFAKSGGDKFIGLPMHESLGGVPLLEDVTANFACRITARLPGGDHLIVVGEVLSYEQSTRAPLLYTSRNYHRLGEIQSRNRD